MPKISIIIPTYNEANHLPLLLSDLSILEREGETIIVDCGSKDKTIDIANIYGSKVYKSNKKNRGSQLSIGANNAKGEWFIFLHADSRLTVECYRLIEKILINNESFIFFFKFKINNKKFIYRLLEILVNIRSNFLKKPYGDQGLIIHRTNYYKNKGFKKIPLMEDLDFIKRLNKNIIKPLNFPLYTSSRKWEKTNIFSQSFQNWNYRRRWLRGESIDSIYNDYYKNN